MIGVDVFFDILDELHNGFVKLDSEIEIKDTDKFIAEKIVELNEITKHPLLIINKRIDQITIIISLIKSLELLQSNISCSRFYDITTRRGKKTVLKEVDVLNILLSIIAKDIEGVLNVWGKHILINPSRIKL